MSTRRIVVVAFVVLCVSVLAPAQDPTEPITNWTAPPYWTMPVGGQLREHLTGTEASWENQGVSAESASSTSPILPFTAISPCRLVDTRQSPDTPYLDNGGAGETRTYHFNTTSYYSGTGACSLIPTAAALSLSVQFQVTDHQASLIAYPDDVTRPLVASVVAYNTGLFYMNSAIVPTGADGGINVFAQWGGQVVININGYYVPSNIVTTLNGLTGAVGVTGGTGITVTTGASTLTIVATGGSGGLLPTGTTGQTLYHNGSAWTASSNLYHDGTKVGIGTTSPNEQLELTGNLRLPTTTATTGQLKFGGTPFLHVFGTHNVFLGDSAGNLTVSGARNVGMGWQALLANTTGQSGTAVGSNALAANTTGTENSGFGSRALSSNTLGENNAALGSSALSNNTTASGNTAVGHGALQGQSFDNGGALWYSNNTAVGDGALSSNQPLDHDGGTGYGNTAVGAKALNLNSQGTSNSALGAFAAEDNTLGSYNVAMGYYALSANTTSSSSTAVGYMALASQAFNNGGIAWEASNTAVGRAALYSDAPTATNNGIENTAVGRSALFGDTTGSQNVAVGSRSLANNTTGDKNTALGAYALYTQSYAGPAGWASANTALGWSALYSNQPTSTVTGLYNTAVGAGALASNSTGSANIAVGAQAGLNLTTGNYNIDIGNMGVPGEGATIRIGDNSQANTYIAGIYNVAIPSASQVVIDSFGHLGTVPSSIRFKQDVANMGDASSRLMELRPVTFRYKAQPDGPRHFGLIAEEVNEVMPELVVRDATGRPETVAYHELPAMLLNELQKQRATIQAQQAQIAAQKAEIDSLKATLPERDGRLAEVDAKLAQIDILAARLAVLETWRTAK